MMATAAEARAWLVSNGHPELEGQRGRLSQQLLDQYEAAHGPADDYPPGTSPDDFAPDPGWVAADDPPPAAELPPPPAPGAPPPLVTEDRPGRPRAGRIGWTWPRRRAAGEQGPARTPRKPRAGKRLSIAPMVEDTYQEAASAFGGIPPMQRLLRAQAPLAGVMLDPKVRDTAADRVVLQPIARNYELAKSVSGLAGTPLSLLLVLMTAPQPTGNLVAVTDETGQPVPGPDGQPVRVPEFEDPTMQHQLSLIGFRMCVRAMADAAGDAMADIAERAEESAARDELVDTFIAYVLGMPVTPRPEDREEAQDRAAGLRLAGVD